MRVKIYGEIAYQKAPRTTESTVTARSDCAATLFTSLKFFAPIY